MTREELEQLPLDVIARQTILDRQVDIRSASIRLMSSTPGHVTYGVWVNGGKCGDLVVRQSERVGFVAMMLRGGFRDLSETSI